MIRKISSIWKLKISPKEHHGLERGIDEGPEVEKSQISTGQAVLSSSFRHFYLLLQKIKRLILVQAAWLKTKNHQVSSNGSWFQKKANGVGEEDKKRETCKQQETKKQKLSNADKLSSFLKYLENWWSDSPSHPIPQVPQLKYLCHK